jgi:hypothetical protein
MLSLEVVSFEVVLSILCRISGDETEQIKTRALFQAKIVFKYSGFHYYIDASC